MKKIILLSLCFAAIVSNAQNIKLSTGKLITSKTSSVIDMDMASMGQQMKITSESIALINVTATGEQDYKATNTITKLKMAQDGMGQNNSYDSDKKEDKESTIGKEMGDKVNVPTEININKTDGKVTLVTKKSPEKDGDKNPFADLMGGSDPSITTSVNAFFAIDASKKIGDKWIDSTNEAGIKILKNYELKNIENKVATILLTSTSKGTISKEVQGAQMEISMNGKSDGTITVNIETGLVSKNVLNSNTEGTMDIMGQSLAFTMKALTTAIFE